MAVKEILLLGNPKLYESCIPVKKDEIKEIRKVVKDLHDTLIDFREKYNTGRAIAAPQIGIMKKLIYMHIKSPVVFINPVLDDFSRETIQLWDDCMSFPDILVKVKRFKNCRITFRDLKWKKHSMMLEEDLSELLQHEVDHLNGILAIQRANDSKSIILKSEKKYFEK
ncbi:MAG: peptide deformylase [Ignavibacteriaceae bacterium]